MSARVESKIALSPILEGLQPYRVPSHPAPIELRLAGNEGPSIPEELRRFEDPLGETLRFYPSCGDLEAELGRRLGVSADRILLTAGADDALSRAIQLVAAPGREIVLTRPTFAMIERFVVLTGTSLRSVPWWDEPSPVDSILASLGERTSAVVVVSPNNPTGRSVSKAELARLLDGLDGRLLVVDQAYAEFANEDPTEFLLEQPNVVVVRTLSKAFGMAGLRIGVAAASTELVSWMRTIGQPYPVAGPSLAIASRILASDNGWRFRYLEQVRLERERLVGLLSELGQRPIPSQANFVLSEFDDPDWTIEGLAGLGISIRRFPGSGRLARSLRITCPGSTQDWDRLEQSLRSVLAPEALLFDMDGVLADVQGSYRRAIRETAQRFGVSVGDADIRRAKAKGNANNDWVLTWRLVVDRRPGVEFEEVRDEFERLYQGSPETPGLWREETLLVDRRLLARLAERLPLAIVTGRPRQDAERFLAEFELAELFQTVVTMEDGPAKPDPSPVRLAKERLGVEHAWMIGDTPDDMTAARAAGAVPVGFVPTEPTPEIEQSLLASGASRVLSDLSELEDLLPKLKPEEIDS